MWKRTVNAVITAALLLAAGCASGGNASEVRTSAASATISAATVGPPTPGPSVATTSPMGFLRPTAAQEQEMAAALLAVDARMTNAERYVGRTVDTCDDVLKGEITGDALVARVQQRFSGGTMPDFNADQAQQVIDETVRVWCH
jgi:hypothetical protein